MTEDGHPKIRRDRWSEDEYKMLTKYFETTWTLMTLFQRIHKINSNRSYEAVAREVRRWRSKGFEKSKESAIRKLRIGYLDIETSDLNADWGFMLTWYIKPQGSKNYDFGIITQKEIMEGTYDERITRELLEAFSRYDVLYTHYGADRRFDVPFIRTRAIIWGLGKLLPQYLEKFIFDTWVIARNKLKLRRNSLDNIARTLRVKGISKTHLDPAIWKRAHIGDKVSLEYIAKHNKHDVILLERVHKKLAPIERPTYKSM